ncbi:MAG TPA: PilN domain-containing protein [Phycisphaerae bacterium]|nr:PilN domain-containing protein [Phycisphaerae bacterium]
MSTINLLPEDYIARRYRRRANWICSILFAIVMTGVVAAILVSGRSYRHTLEVRERVTADYAEAAKLIQQMQQLDAKKRLLLRKAMLSASLMERVPRSYLLGIITNALPENASLVSFDLDIKRIVQLAAPAAGKKGAKGAPAAAKASDPIVTMTVVGLASTDVEVARLIATLARNPLLNSVDLVYSQEKTIDQTAVREFRIVLELKPNVDVLDVAREANPSAPPAPEPLARADAGANT